MVRIGWNDTYTRKQARFTRNAHRYVVTGDNVRVYERDYVYGSECAVTKGATKYWTQKQRTLIDAVQTVINS